MKFNLVELSQLIATEIQKLSGKQININDYSQYTYYSFPKQKIIIEPPITIEGGYPDYTSAKDNGFGTLFRIAITEDELVAVVYPNIIERDKENYNYYRNCHMMHRIFYETNLTDKDSISNIIEFVTKKYELPECHYCPEEIDPEVIEKEKKLAEYLYIDTYYNDDLYDDEEFT